MVIHQLVVISFNKILPRLKSKCSLVSQPWSLIVCVILVEYKLCTHSCLLYSFSSWGHSTAAQFLPTQGSSPGATRSMRTSRRSSPSRRPCGALLSRVIVYVLRFRILCIRHFVIIVINNIRICFIISFYVICAVMYCSFCCIYVLLDP